VHFSLNGQDRDENFEGIVYLFNNARASVQAKYSGLGGGSAITGVIISAGPNRVEVSLTDTPQITWNGDQTMNVGDQKDSETLIARYKDRVEVLVDAKKTLRVSILIDPKTNTLDVNVNIVDDMKEPYTGILRDGKGKANEVSKEQCLFQTYLPWRRTSGWMDPKRKDAAIEACKEVPAHIRKDCEKDYMMTGVNFSASYIREERRKNDAIKKNAFL